ncbi:MAG: hypothetical protein H6766_01760 [Candidatus Peribacteria bacterium]|nr:MAG: hypothetical protein H6766_01760 [Candidatus Peribacteria bacterium]
MYTIIGNPKKIAQSKTLPSGQYKSIFSIGEDSYDIQFAYPISIETQTDLPDGNNAIIYTSQDNINRSYHGYGSTSNGMTTFSTDHFTYFAVGDISGHFVINNNNTHTNTGNVTLNNNIAGAVSMRFGNTPAARDAASWESYSSNKSWNLGGIPGVHTVYAAFQNDIGDIVTVSDDIIWEDVPPSSFDTTNLRMWYDVADVSTITQSAGLVSQRRDKS